MKKSQITIFVILGLFSVILISLLLYAYSLRLKDYSPDKDYLFFDRFVDHCIEGKVYESVYKIGAFGGHYPLPSNYEYMNFTVTKGASSNGSFFLPHRLSIAAGLEALILQEIYSCIDPSLFERVDLISFSPDDFVSVDILDNNVLVRVGYERTIVSDVEDSFTSKKYFDIPIRLGTVIDFVGASLVFFLEDSGVIPVSKLNALADEYDLRFFIESHGRSNILVVHDVNSSILRNSDNEIEPFYFVTEVVYE
jgi:hypothetical protein